MPRVIDLQLIIDFIAIFISLFGYIFAYKYLAQEKYKLSVKNILIQLVITAILVLNNEYNHIMIKSITTLTIIILMFIIIFKNKTQQIFVLVSEIVFLSMIYQIILVGIIYFPRIDKIININILEIIMTIITSISVYFIVKIPKMHQIILKTLQKINNKKYDFTLVILLITIVNLIAVNLMVIYDREPGHMLTVFILLLIALIVYIYYLKNEETTLDMKNKSLMRRGQLYTTVVNDYKTLVHNYKNSLLSIKNIDSKKEKDLIKEKINTYDKKLTLIADIEKTPRGIKEIFYEKFISIDNSKINIISFVDNEVVDKMSLSIFNALCETLGIALDNAVEAFKESENSVINVEIEEEKDKLKITIINLFNNNIDIEEFGNINYSTKKRGSGYGVSSILKNKKIKIDYKIINNLFQTVINAKIKNTNMK